MSRPELTTDISLNDFESYYWLRSELINFCRSNGLSTAGGKLEIANRIRAFLTKEEIESVEKTSSISKFDWNNEALSLGTVITDNYKNSENVRAFMTNQIGQHFRFNVEFMKWIKLNVGKTMQEAVTEWKRIYELKKDKKYKTDIAPQFEYNRYMRDFLADNPNKSPKEAMKFWKLKRQISGSKEYSKNDLFLENGKDNLK